jgi:NADH:ubiquinone reductase (H+-translocating)
MMIPSNTAPHCVIVGGGFGGLWATRALASSNVRITLIDRSNHHLFQPLLYQVATAGLSSPDIAAPLRRILRKQRNVEVRMGEVTGIDVANSTVTLADQSLVHYDYLLVATGSTHAYFGHNEWAAHAPGLKTLDDALAIRRKLLLAFERAEAATNDAERDAWLSFAVVGAGPTGVELAGTLAEISRHTLKQEFRHIDPGSARVRLIEAGPRVLAAFPVSLSNKAQQQLERLGVDVLLGAPVAEITDAGYRINDVLTPCRTVLWAAGVAASKLGAMLGAEGNVALDRAGRVCVNSDLSIAGHPNVFVAGAKQMGAHVAKNINALLDQKPTQPFRYADYGNLATIGRMAAIVDLRGIKFSGLLAWWFWLAAHIFFLIGFRNRISVLINWASAYWTFQRHARIILGNDDAGDATRR